MMGERTTEQPALFYGFSLERHVPADHLFRSIDRFVDFTGIREHLRPYYSETGRPSIDPELIIRHRLHARDQVRATALRGGAPQSRLPLVLLDQPSAVT